MSESIENEEGSMLIPAAEEGKPIEVAEGEYLLSDSIKGTGEIPEWYKSSKYKTVQAQAEAYNSLESKLGSFTGAPEEYTLTVPDGLEGEFRDDDPLLMEARTMFKEMGVNQEGFDRIMGLYLGGTTDDPAQTEANRQENIVEVLGENHAQRISQVSGALSNLLGPEKYAEVMPHVTSASTILAIEAVILANAPKVAPIDNVSNPEGITKAKHSEMMNAKTDDGKAIRYNVDRDYRASVDAYAEQLYNEKM